MAIFSVVTTGFCMTASYCLKAQTKARVRLTEVNRQSTTAEDFGGAIDTTDNSARGSKLSSGDAVVQQLSTSGKNYVFKFPFSQIKDEDGDPVGITNNNVTGFKIETEDEVYQMSFFSVQEAVSLVTTDDANGEYWVSIMNYDTAEDGDIAVGFRTSGIFFDNIKRSTFPFDQLGNRIIVGMHGEDSLPGELCFGIKGASPTLDIIDWETKDPMTATPINIADFDKSSFTNLEADKHQIKIYYYDGTFHNYAQYKLDKEGEVVTPAEG